MRQPKHKYRWAAFLVVALCTALIGIWYGQEDRQTEHLEPHKIRSIGVGGTRVPAGLSDHNPARDQHPNSEHDESEPMPLGALEEPEPATWEGYIYGPDGVPLRKHWHSIRAMNEGRTNRTNEHGFFRAEGLAPGKAKLSIKWRQGEYSYVSWLADEVLEPGKTTRGDYTLTGLTFSGTYFLQDSIDRSKDEETQRWSLKLLPEKGSNLPEYRSKAVGNPTPANLAEMKEVLDFYRDGSMDHDLDENDREALVRMRKAIQEARTTSEALDALGDPYEFEFRHLQPGRYTMMMEIGGITVHARPGGPEEDQMFPLNHYVEVDLTAGSVEGMAVLINLDDEYQQLLDAHD